MKTFICHCRQCTEVRKRQRGRHSWRHADIKAKKHGLRSTVRTRLRQGEYDDLPESITADYFA